MRSPILFACVFSLGFAGTVLAQTTRKDSGGNAQLMQQMQQMAAERTQLQAENSRLKRELEDTRKERDTFKGNKEGNDKRAFAGARALARAIDERDASARELEQLKGNTQNLVAKFRETIAEMRTVETDRNAAKQQLATRDIELKTCVADNLSLYTLNEEILGKLENGGFWSGVARAEPFTKLKRVQLENLIDEYRGRAEDSKVAPPAPTPAPAG